MKSTRTNSNPGIESLVTQKISDFRSVGSELKPHLRTELIESHKQSISMLAIYCQENPESYVERYEIGIGEKADYQKKGGTK